MVVFRSATYLDLSEAWICSPFGQGLAQSTPLQTYPNEAVSESDCVSSVFQHGTQEIEDIQSLIRECMVLILIRGLIFWTVYIKVLLDPHGPMPDQEQTKIYIGPLSSPTRHHHLHHLSSVSCGERLSLTFYIHIDRQRRLLRREVTQVQLDIRLGRLKPSQFDDPAARYRSIID